MIADHGFFLLLQVRQDNCPHLEEMDKTMDNVVFLKVDLENTLGVNLQLPPLWPIGAVGSQVYMS